MSEVRRLTKLSYFLLHSSIINNNNNVFYTSDIIFLKNTHYSLDSVLCINFSFYKHI